MQIGGIRKGWLGYSMAVVAGIGFLAGVSALGIKKPGFRQTNMTPEEYYRYAAVVPPPPQEVGIFDDILEREYFSPGLVKKAFAGDAESQYWLAWCYNAKNATSAQQAEAAEQLRPKMDDIRLFYNNKPSTDTSNKLNFNFNC
jgi:hypothetical protein